MTLLEISANTVITLSIFLAGRNSVHTWWTGILGCILFGMLFFQVRLYAEVLLQLFFVLTSGIGWWQWRFGLNGKPRLITKVERWALLKVALIGICVAVTYGLLLHWYTNAYAPFVDSAVLVFSVIAQILMMKRRIDAWKFWLLVNTIAVPLYLSRELYLTAGLYAAYWVNAIVAYHYWEKAMPSVIKPGNEEITLAENESV